MAIGLMAAGAPIVGRADSAPPLALWALAGYPGAIPDIESPLLNVRSYGAAGDGVADDAAAIQSAINAASNPSVVWLPAGTYRITAMLTLRSGVVLRGEGYRLTHIHCVSAAGCIRAAGSAGSYTAIQSGLVRGTTQLTVADASGFVAGRGGQIQEDDPEPPAASWGANYIGQMVTIVAVNGNTLTIDPALIADYSAGLNPRIRPVQYLEQAGIEDLHLKRLSSGTASDESSIHFSRAADSWIRRVESDWTERYHVSVSESLHLEFRDSYFHDAESRGDGGEGYGVSLAHLVTGALVENNIFSDVRHAMILQMGATGNVFGYNFARRNYSDDGWDKTAIALHGHYPSANLFEANTVGWAGADMVWGPNGPENTFFRNRIVGTNRNADFGAYRGIWMQGWRGRQYLVCNEINTIGAARVSEDGVYIPSSADGDPADVIQHANVIRGVLTLNPEWSAILPASYYLVAKPAFFGMVSWPALGCDQPFGQGKDPAQLRWESGEYIPDADPFGIALTGIPQDGAVLLVWTAEGAAPEGLYWRLSLLRDGEVAPMVIDGIPAGDRNRRIEGLVNGSGYTATLEAVGDAGVAATVSVRVMPADHWGFLPLVSQ